MWRVISKEARELAASPRAMAILLLVSCLVLWLAVRLPEQRDALRVHVTDEACAVDVSGAGVEVRACATPSAAHVREALSDAPDIVLVDVRHPRRDVWALIDRNDIDAALIWTPVATGADEYTPGYARGGVWTAYSDPRGRADTARLDLALRLLTANDIFNARWQTNARTQSDSADQPHAEAVEPVFDEAGEVVAQPEPEPELEPAPSAPQVRLPSVGPVMLGSAVAANELGATPVLMVTRNGPAASDSSWLAPGLIALISTFVAFLAGASGLARESEQGTLHWLLGATHSSWLQVGAAKVIVGTSLGALTLIALIIFNWLALDNAVNPNLVAILPVQALSLLVAAMQGVAVSALVGRQDQAFLISGAYLILLSLFSGVFMPVAGAGGGAEWISWLLPTTFSQAGLVDWMQQASAQWDLNALLSLAALLAGTTLAWFGSLRVLALRQ